MTPRAVLFPVCVGVLAALPVGACKSSATAAPDAAPAVLALPPPVQLAEAVCKLRTRLFAPDAEVPMRLSGTAPAFAIFPVVRPSSDRKVARMGADLELPSDEEMPFGLHLRGNGVDLLGQVDRRFPIRAALPLGLGKFAAALPSSPLHVVRASNMELEVEADLGSSIEVTSGPLRTRGPCSLFAIEEGDFSPTAVIPGVAWKQTPDALLAPDRSIGLTTLPLGEPAARLKPGPNENRAVSVFEKDVALGRSHIGWFGGPVLVHGWVASTDLVPLPKGGAELPKTKAKEIEVPPPDAPFAHGTAKCAANVTVIGQLGEARAVVGTVGNDVPFEVLERSGGWAQIRPKVSPLRLTPGTRLLVRESDLAACEKSGP